MPMLIICPTILMVPTAPEAVPRYFCSTELITMLELGDENRPNPTQSIAKRVIKKDMCVSSFIKQSNISPNEITPIPADAIMPGFFLSESLPAIGDRSVIAKG